MKFLLDFYLYENARRICAECKKKRYVKDMIPNSTLEKQLEWTCKEHLSKMDSIDY